MSESKHTPLPWDVFAMGEIVGGGKGHLQRVVRTDWEHAPEAEIPEREANAALIVRAVNERAELIEALKALAKHCARELGDDVLGGGAYTEAMRIIARAEAAS